MDLRPCSTAPFMTSVPPTLPVTSWSQKSFTLCSLSFSVSPDPWNHEGKGSRGLPMGLTFCVHLTVTQRVEGRLKVSWKQGLHP